MLRPLHFAHTLVRAALQAGGIAVDATAGNGYDTELLAQCVEQHGRVFAFDVQAQAIEATRSRLRAAALESRVTLFHTGHEHMRTCLPAEVHGRVDVVMFNFGYLPHGNKAITTMVETSLRALQATTELLAPNGLLTAMLYPGHAEGTREAEHIAAWAQALPQAEFHALRYEITNMQNSPPWLVAIQKSGVLQ